MNVTVIGETRHLHTAHRRHLRTGDGRYWLISATPAETIVVPADHTGQVTDWRDVVFVPGRDLDGAQAAFERLLANGPVPAPEPLDDADTDGLAAEEAVDALRGRLTLPVRRAYGLPTVVE